MSDELKTPERWDDRWDDKPHGWVQWKGTNVCMDFHCDCGAVGHVDGLFAYHIKCGACGKVWEVDGHVFLREPGDDYSGECTLTAAMDDEGASDE